MDRRADRNTSSDPDTNKAQILAVYAWLYRNDRDWLATQPPVAVSLNCKNRSLELLEVNGVRNLLFFSLTVTS